jgi:hypothetical protein
MEAFYKDKTVYEEYGHDPIPYDSSSTNPNERVFGRADPRSLPFNPFYTVSQLKSMNLPSNHRFNPSAPPVPAQTLRLQGTAAIMSIYGDSLFKLSEAEMWSLIRTGTHNSAPLAAMILGQFLFLKGSESLADHAWSTLQVAHSHNTRIRRKFTTCTSPPCYPTLQVARRVLPGSRLNKGRRKCVLPIPSMVR